MIYDPYMCLMRSKRCNNKSYLVSFAGDRSFRAVARGNMACAHDVTDLSKPEVVINEVLCFIQQKSELLAADNLMKICSDYYSVEDIEKACTTLARFDDKKRVPKQKGSDQEIHSCTVSLMIKLCLDPSIRL